MPAPAQLAAIVMPPATGKSHLLWHNDLPYVEEADDICMPRATVLLSELRDSAQLDNDWTAYDQALAKIMKTRLKPDTRIVLLSAVGLADALGATVIGVFVLSPSVWVKNVEKRNKPVSKYIRCYTSALRAGAETCATNDELREKVTWIITSYLAALG